MRWVLLGIGTTVQEKERRVVAITTIDNLLLGRHFLKDDQADSVSMTPMLLTTIASCILPTKYSLLLIEQCLITVWIQLRDDVSAFLH